METKYIDIIFCGPPSADVGSLWKILDDRGEPVEFGWWDHDGTHWVYRCPVEMVPKLTILGGQSAQGGKLISGEDADRGFAHAHSDVPSAAIEARRRLKQKVREAQVTAQPAATPANWIGCPSPACGNRFDPSKYDLLSCGNCGEDRSTACCLPDPTKPCVDCQSLVPDAGEGGYGEGAGAAPPSDNLFDGKFHPKDGLAVDGEDDE